MLRVMMRRVRLVPALVVGGIVGGNVIVGGHRVDACTIFVLTDSERTLFFNNEDYSNPTTRIWFVPGSEARHACVFVGFDDGWAQGGMNSAGLAYDWVAGFQDKWEPGDEFLDISGNPSVRLLETCATVEEAIAFYRTHRETSFSNARILVADRSGKSVIIGAKDGELLVEQSSQCRGFGYGQQTVEEKLAAPPEPTVENGVAILRACLQPGQYATKYSNVFDLKSGDIFLFQFPEHEDPVRFNLTAELEKGPHYYDIPEIRGQATEAPRPLLENMKPMRLDSLQPIPDNDGGLTKHVQSMFQDALAGTMRPEDFQAEFWKQIEGKRQEIQSQLKQFGEIDSVTLVYKRDENGQRLRRYRIEFSGATVLQLLAFDSDGKVTSATSEDIAVRKDGG
jgi:hypothetical protein